MKMNENVAKGKWLEIKGDVQKAWGKLTDDDLDKAKGDIKKIAEIIQQKYGAAEAEHRKKLSEIFKKHEIKNWPKSN